MFLVFLSAAAVLVLLLVLWTVRLGLNKVVSAYDPTGFHQIDIRALGNLLSQDEDDFLRSSLTRADYRRVRHARVRAMQEYLFWIAENCAMSIALLRSQPRAMLEGREREAEYLVRSALQLRLISLGVWALLWIEYLSPFLNARPVRLVSRYEHFWRIAEAHFCRQSAAPILSRS
jgi:hypothetical protein